MIKKPFALAACRVSSTEQLENNSLNRQRDAVLKAAQGLDVVIPDDGWWSGSVSSKRGTNVNRKDLQEMIVRCKRDKRVKYVIVDEPDRFMRSIDEAAYFEVTFRQLGVTVWYASDPELNKGDLSSKLLKFTKYLSAEGSNEERQHKSVSGQTKALQEGRWPFVPKPGYKRGYERGIPEIDENRGPILRDILLSIVTKRATPTQALIAFNKSDFMKGHSPYKMDKFRNIVTDPFYGGIVEIDKQVKVRNENGLHEALITKDQHYELVRIMSDKKKTQAGPRKNGNPKYPLSNLVHCDNCKEKRNGRIVGFDHGNGKPNSPTYEKYRCRSCGKYQLREDLHEQLTVLLAAYQLTPDTIKELAKALRTVWKQKEGEAEQLTVRLRHKIKVIEESIAQQVEAVTDPGNASIKQEILASIEKKKLEIQDVEDQIETLRITADDDKEQFVKFGLSFVEDVAKEFLEISYEERMRCKELLFPAGFRLNAAGKVYTPEVSIIYRVAATKKDAEASNNSLMVRVRGL